MKLMPVVVFTFAIVILYEVLCLANMCARGQLKGVGAVVTVGGLATFRGIRAMVGTVTSSRELRNSDQRSRTGGVRTRDRRGTYGSISIV